MGELDARALLEEEGFSVTGEQVQGKWDVWVDGEPQEVEVFADYLVEQEGLVFVAEVKTGERAPTVKTAATRRQLLEYLFVFQADGLLLVNMETREIHEIQFEFGKEFKGG